MKQFMDKDFILETETAKKLYNDYAKDLPIIDYHCHVPPKEIYENRKFNNIAEVWLGGHNKENDTYFGDHYKWRLMRTNGIDEEIVCGDADGYEKFTNFAKTLPLAIGNPMYHWCHLELKKYFGFEKDLNEDTAKEAWELCNSKLQNDEKLTVRGIIESSNVAFIGTTDDPIDSLEWHEKIAADTTFKTKVCPSYRPDKAINIQKAGFKEYIVALAKSVGKDNLNTATEVMEALENRAKFFKDHGCKASDHGIDYVPFKLASVEEVNAIFKKAIAGEVLSKDEIDAYQTYIMLGLGKTYKKLDIVMQIHYSCYRNSNEKKFKKFGADTGFDVMAQNDCSIALVNFLNELEKTDELPKTVLFSLNPNDNEVIDTILGAFQSSEMKAKIQHGPSWWFCDTKSGMEEHMKSLANLSLLGNFIGMLTDSRSFLSYTRHEYFRRILCNFVGNLVENGEYPNNEKELKKIIEGICYYNAKNYFGI